MVAPVDMVLLTKPPQEESVLERFHPLKNFMWTALSDKLTLQTLFLSLTPTVTSLPQATLLTPLTQRQTQQTLRRMFMRQTLLIGQALRQQQ